VTTPPPTDPPPPVDPPPAPDPTPAGAPSPAPAPSPAAEPGSAVPPPAPDPAAAAPGAPPLDESRHDRRARRREERRERRQLDGGPSSAGLVFGIILVVAGAIILAGRLADLSLGASAWPLWLIVPGVAMVVGSFAIPPRGGLGLAIPGAMLTMVGVVLWVQAATGLYATWAYAWALVAPTGPGLGMLLYGLARGDGDLARDGLRTTLVGLGLFVGFGLFFEGVLGLSGQEFVNAREILPYGAIALGVVLVLASFLGRRENPTSV
jgi:hypothetical protein